MKNNSMEQERIPRLLNSLVKTSSLLGQLVQLQLPKERRTPLVFSKSSERNTLLYLLEAQVQRIKIVQQILNT